MTIPPLIVLLGPTASGKTRLGVALAQHLNGEIISADSRQVFKGMNIGTGKDLEEYGTTPYHLIDICTPGEEFSLFQFATHYCAAFQDIHQRNRHPILVGGTGLYLDAVIQGYTLAEAPLNPELRARLRGKSQQELVKHLEALNPDTHNTTDRLDPERTLRAIEIALAQASRNCKTLRLPNVDKIILGIQWPRELLKARITCRLKDRLANGMIEEVERLRQQGVSWKALDSYGLEYRFIAQYLQGELTYNDLYQKLNAAIHYFAKQQEKWFRRMERKGIGIHWLNGEEDLLPQALALLD